MSLANETLAVVGFASQQRLCLVSYAEIFRQKLLCASKFKFILSVWVKICLAKTDSPFCVFLLLMAAIVLYL